jgi:hypothetical protein
MVSTDEADAIHRKRPSLRCREITMSAFWCAVSAWRWDIIGGVSGVVGSFLTLIIVFYLNSFEQARRRRRLLRAGDAYFVIPSSIHHRCRYAVQNELEHLVQTIVLPPNAEIVVDLALRPSVEFDTTETAFGCDGDLSKKPYPFEYYNRFIESGHRRHVIPGLDNAFNDYLDKHHYYHTVEQSRFNVGNVKAMGFKIRTLSTGTYQMKMEFSGSTVRGEFTGLTIVISDTMFDVMHCVDPNHQHRDCVVGIRRRIPTGEDE